jgi:hypothetical protein
MTSPAGISFFWLISLPLCDWATSVPASRWGRLSLDKQVVGVRCCSEGGDAQQLLLSESAAQAKQLVAWASDLDRVLKVTLQNCCGAARSTISRANCNTAMVMQVIRSSNVTVRTAPGNQRDTTGPKDHNDASDRSASSGPIYP